MSYVCDASKTERPMSVKIPKISKDDSLKLLESTVPTPPQEGQLQMEYTVVDEIRVTPGNPVEDIRRGENRHEKVICACARSNGVIWWQNWVYTDILREYYGFVW